MKIRELIQETTCSGAVATVSMPLGGTLAREGTQPEPSPPVVKPKRKLANSSCPTSVRQNTPL